MKDTHTQTFGKCSARSNLFISQDTFMIKCTCFKIANEMKFRSGVGGYKFKFWELLNLLSLSPFLYLLLLRLQKKYISFFLD